MSEKRNNPALTEPAPPRLSRCAEPYGGLCEELKPVEGPSDAGIVSAWYGRSITELKRIDHERCDRVRTLFAGVRAAPVQEVELCGDGVTRCQLCGWPLKETTSEGCTKDSCSYRPAMHSEEWHRLQRRRAFLEGK